MTDHEAQRAREITDEIQLSAQEAIDTIRAAKDEAARARRKEGYFWLVMILTAVVGPSLAIFLSAHNTRQSEQKFCAIVDTSVRQAQARLASYRAAPPNTPAGVAQQNQATLALVQMATLQRSLGCPIEEQ